MRILKRLTHFIKCRFDLFTLKTAMQIFTAAMLLGGGALLLSYLLSMRNVEVQALESSSRYLSEIVNMVDANLQYIDGLATSVSISKEAAYLRSMSYLSAQDRIRHITYMANLLNLQKYSNSLIHSIYLYYPRDEVVIFDALYQAEDVDDVRYIDPESGFITLTPHTRFSRFNEYGYQDLLKIVKSMGDVSGQDAFAVVNISADRLSRFIDSLLLTSGQKLYLCDSHGQAVLADKRMPQEPISPGVITEGAEKFIVVQQESLLTGWSFCLVIPFDEFFWNYRSIKTYVPFICLGVFLLSGIFGIAISLHISRPVNRLYYSVTSGQESRQDHLKYLLKSYEELLPVHQKLRDEMGLMHFLLHTPGKDLEKLQPFHDIFPYGSFWILTIDLQTPAGASDYLDSVLCYPLIQEAFSGLEGQLALKVVQTEPHRLAVILNFDSHALSSSSFFPIFSDLVLAIHEDLNVSLNLGVSSVKCSLEEVHIGFQESLRALEYKFISGNNEVIYFSDSSLPTSSAMTYPTELEQELLENLRLGDEKRVEKALQSLEDYRLSICSTHPAFSHMTLSCMVNAVRQMAFRLMPESEAEAICNAALSKDSDRISVMREISGAILNFMGEMKKNKNEGIAQKILAYIEENFAQPLTVESISNAFGISSSSCYRILREQKQISPMNYMTMVRVENAARLLKQTSDPVKKISAQCGFESLQIFYRQFKNLKGVSPGAYRRGSQEAD